MIKKIVKIIGLILVMFAFIYNDSFANESNLKIENIKSECIINNLENNNGNLTKKIIDINEKTGEIIVELKVYNEPKNNGRSGSFFCSR